MLPKCLELLQATLPLDGVNMIMKVA